MTLIASGEPFSTASFIYFNSHCPADHPSFHSDGGVVTLLEAAEAIVDALFGTASVNLGMLTFMIIGFASTKISFPFALLDADRDDASTHEGKRISDSLLLERLTRCPLLRVVDDKSELIIIELWPEREFLITSILTIAAGSATKTLARKGLLSPASRS